MRYTHYHIEEGISEYTLTLLKKGKEVMDIKRINYSNDGRIKIRSTEESYYYHTQNIAFKKLTSENWKKIQPILVAQLQEAINDLGNKDIVFS